MQVARFWRMNAQRYRLQGVRYANGEVSLQARTQTPTYITTIQREAEATVAVQPHVAQSLADVAAR
jgi:hypothetical protein